MKVSTNWLKDYVSLNPPLESVAERLTMAGLEVKKMEPVPERKDILFEVEITTNRPDWLSHIGVAREIAAVENLSFKIPVLEKTVNRPMPPGWRLNLRDPEGCPYYTGVYLEGIQNVPTPDFMRERLEVCGIRSIGFIVDVTNYVLLETGQPLHAFDADSMKAQEIQVRRAKAGEKFIAINGEEYKLEPQDLVIADSERAVALAGVMGGKETEVTERTRNILLESAFFLPRLVRQSSRRLGLASDSSYRFERRVDPDGVDYARERAISLLQQYGKPRFVSAVIRAGEKPSGFKGPIHLTMAEIDKRLGLKIKAHQVASILTRLGLDAKPDSTEAIKVQIPSFRSDITKPIDLIEEVARIYGYDNIPETFPARPLPEVSTNPLWKLEDTTRNFFSGIGFSEAVTFSLIAPTGLDPEKDLASAVQVNNPLNKELTWLRPVMLPSLLSVVQRNQNHGAHRISLYEVGNVYSKAEAQKQTQEEKVVSLVIAGKWKEKSWLDPEREATFYDVKGVVERFLVQLKIANFEFVPTSKTYFTEPVAEKILIEGQEIGFLGEVNQKTSSLWDLSSKVYFAQISLSKLISKMGTQRKYQEVSRYPAIERDLSILVPDSVKAKVVESEIQKRGQGLIQSIDVFDLFKGGRVPAGHKNLAFRITYQAADKTLLSEEIQKLHTEIAADIVKIFQASFQ
jgi:phenylalanyl-tRNA synthetase beta chain